MKWFKPYKYISTENKQPSINCHQQTMADRILEARHSNHVYRVINNGGYNLRRPGNQGRYTHSRHITSVEDWDAVLDYLRLPPLAYETSGYIYDHSFGRVQAHLLPNAFPEVVLIPLPSTTPGWRRCIFHIESVENIGNGHPLRQQLTGRYIPVPVSYHENHPIAEAITRIFHTEAPDTPFYQSNEELAILTSADRDDTWIREMASLLAQPGNNFEAFDRIVPEVIVAGNVTNVLPDLELVRRANRTIIIPDYDMDPIGARAASEQWRDMVYLVPATEEQRREAYARYAADQINIHRRERIQFGYDHPAHPNPYLLPSNDYDYDDYDDDYHEHENNPADRVRAQNHNHNHHHHHPANTYIQQLYNAQNNDERARIAAVDVVPDLPRIRLRELDG